MKKILKVCKDNIPQDLKELLQWVAWRSEVRGNKPTKIPYNVKTGGYAKSTSPDTWVDFQTAFSSYNNGSGYNGIGFVLSKDDPFCGIDVDHCIDRNGRIQPWAQAIIDDIKSYSEISPSGTGVRIFVKASLPPGGRKKGNIECYQDGRYLTVTGHHIKGTPTTIEDRQSEISSFHTEIFKSKKSFHNDRTNAQNTSLDDRELLQMAFRSKNGAEIDRLYKGDWSSYPSQSEADQALCNYLAFWFDRDPERINNVFKSSGLYRDKWDKKHYGDGRTYGQVTIEKAIASTTHTYQERKAQYSKSNKRSCNNNCTSINEGWPDPIRLDQTVIPEISLDFFPDAIIAPFIQAVSDFTQTAKELTAAMTLATLSLASQKKFIIEVRNGYIEPVSIYAVAAIDPGERKSAVYDTCMTPINEWEAEHRERLKPEIKKAISKQTTLLKRIEILRKKASQSKDKDSVLLIQQEIEETEAHIPEIPVLPQLYADDITPEAFAELLEEQGERLAVMSDEGGIFETMAGRYSGGIPNIDVYLKGHSGSPVRVNRKGKRPVILTNPAVTMGIVAQPDVIQGLDKKPGFRGRGLIARCLYFLPTSRLGYRSIESPEIPGEILRAYNKLIRSILDMSWNKSLSDEKIPYTLALSSEAYKEWVEFYDHVEVRLRQNEPYEFMRDWAGKMPGAGIRLSGLFHIAKHAFEKPWEYRIDIDTVQKAISLIIVIAEHTRAAFNLMGEDEEIEKANKIWQWISKKGKLQFSKRECQQSLKSRYKRWEDIKLGLGCWKELIPPK